MQPLFTDNFAKSDFVAKVKIKAVRDSAEYYVVEIATIDLFKGVAATRLKIGDRNTSCEMTVQENSTWLIFASKNGKGELIFGMCSNPLELDGSRYESNPDVQKKVIAEGRIKLKILACLRNEKIPVSNTNNYIYTFYNILKKIEGFEVTEKQFSFYQILINKERMVTDVKPVKPFADKKLSAAVMEKLKNAVLAKPKHEKFPDEETMVICLYAYPPEPGYKSFVSIYGL